MGYWRKKATFVLFSSVVVMRLFCIAPHFSDAGELTPFIVTAEDHLKLDPLDAYDSKFIETIMQVCEGMYMYNYSSAEMESIPYLADPS